MHCSSTVVTYAPTPYRDVRSHRALIPGLRDECSGSTGSPSSRSNRAPPRLLCASLCSPSLLPCFAFLPLPLVPLFPLRSPPVGARAQVDSDGPATVHHDRTLDSTPTCGLVALRLVCVWRADVDFVRRSPVLQNPSGRAFVPHSCCVPTLTHPSLRIDPPPPPVMSTWKHELERLAQPADLTGRELESSRIRAQQQQQRPQQPQHKSHEQQPGRGVSHPSGVIDASYSAATIHSERHHHHDSDSHLACESCSAHAARSFCSTCDQLLCGSCDARLHATVSAAQSHARAPAAQVVAFRVPCPETHAHTAHRLPAAQLLLRFYCRTCSRPVCSACRSAPGGAHPDSGPAHARHEVVRLEDAWAAQMRVLSGMVGSASAMHDKKQQILGELRSMDRALAQLSSALLQSESLEAAQTSQILSRLHNISELNGVKINQAVARIQGDIQAIDEFLNRTGIVPVPTDSDPGAGVSTAAATTAPASTAATASAFSASSSSTALAPATPTTMCRFLRSCHLWPADAAQLAMLPSDSAAETPALTALPREAHDRSHALSQFPRLLSLLRVKDELLRFAMASRKGLLAEQAAHLATLQSLYEESQREMEAWMTLSQRLSREMQACKQKCCFCGVALSGAAASTPCAQNQPQPQSQQHPQQQQAPFEGLDRREGDGLHYFVSSA